MASRTDWPTFFLAIAAGIVIGVASALIGVWAGLPTAYVGPIAGGMVGALVPLIYRLRARPDAGGVRRS
jgi:hypothetical protein